MTINCTIKDLKVGFIHINNYITSYANILVDLFNMLGIMEEYTSNITDIITHFHDFHDHKTSHLSIPNDNTFDKIEYTKVKKYHDDKKSTWFIPHEFTSTEKYFIICFNNDNGQIKHTSHSYEPAHINDDEEPIESGITINFTEEVNGYVRIYIYDSANLTSDQLEYINQTGHSFKKHGYYYAHGTPIVERLLTELHTQEDVDDNAEIFGYDFIFEDLPNTPPAFSVKHLQYYTTPTDADIRDYDKYISGLTNEGKVSPRLAPIDPRQSNFKLDKLDYLLINELTSGIDIDGNGLVFGYDFIFNPDDQSELLTKTLSNFDPIEHFTNSFRVPTKAVSNALQRNKIRMVSKHFYLSTIGLEEGIMKITPPTLPISSIIKTLSDELTSGKDENGDGLVFGKDFHIMSGFGRPQELNYTPPTLPPMLLTWNAYLLVQADIASTTENLITDDYYARLLLKETGLIPNVNRNDILKDLSKHVVKWTGTEWVDLGTIYDYYGPYGLLFDPEKVCEALEKKYVQWFNEAYISDVESLNVTTAIVVMNDTRSDITYPFNQDLSYNVLYYEPPGNWYLFGKYKTTPNGLEFEKDHSTIYRYNKIYRSFNRDHMEMIEQNYTSDYIIVIYNDVRLDKTSQEPTTILANDYDGNNLIYGTDFIINPYDDDCPEILKAHAFDSTCETKYTWQQYLKTLIFPPPIAMHSYDELMPKLTMEFRTNQDLDGNGLIYGKDFYITHLDTSKGECLWNIENHIDFKSEYDADRLSKIVGLFETFNINIPKENPICTTYTSQLPDGEDLIIFDTICRSTKNIYEVICSNEARAKALGVDAGVAVNLFNKPTQVSIPCPLNIVTITLQDYVEIQYSATPNSSI